MLGYTEREAELILVNSNTTGWCGGREVDAFAHVSMEQWRTVKETLQLDLPLMRYVEAEEDWVYGIDRDDYRTQYFISPYEVLDDRDKETLARLCPLDVECSDLIPDDGLNLYRAIRHVIRDQEFLPRLDRAVLWTSEYAFYWIHSVDFRMCGKFLNWDGVGCGDFTSLELDRSKRQIHEFRRATRWAMKRPVELLVDPGDAGVERTFVYEPLTSEFLALDDLLDLVESSGCDEVLMTLPYDGRMRMGKVRMDCGITAIPRKSRFLFSAGVYNWEIPKDEYLRYFDTLNYRGWGFRDVLDSDGLRMIRLSRDEAISPRHTSDELVRFRYGSEEFFCDREVWYKILRGVFELDEVNLSEIMKVTLGILGKTGVPDAEYMMRLVAVTFLTWSVAVYESFETYKNEKHAFKEDRKKGVVGRLFSMMAWPIKTIATKFSKATSAIREFIKELIEQRVEVELPDDVVGGEGLDVSYSAVVTAADVEPWERVRVSKGVKALTKRIDERMGYTTHTFDFSLTYVSRVFGVSPLEKERDYKTYAGMDPVGLIQYGLDHFEPAAVYKEYQWRGEIFHQQPLKLDHQVEYLKTDFLENSEYGPRTYWVPRVKSTAGVNKRQTLKETIYSLSARNFDPPTQAENLDMEALAREVVEYYIEQGGRDDAKEYLALCAENPIEVDTRSLDDAFSKMSPQKVEQLLKADVYRMEWTDTGELRLIVRGKPKPKAKPSDQYGEAQTIAFNPSEINMLFTGDFNELARRTTGFLPSNARFGARISEAEVGDWASKFSREKEFYLENDFSKYDKGEGYNIQPIEYLFYRIFGLKVARSDEWFMGQFMGRAKAVCFLFTVFIELQRRSGQLTTLLGNTIICDVTVMFVYRVKKKDVLWKFTKGDDIIIAFKSRPPLILNVEERMMSLFGLVGKPEYFRNGYCASRFFIRTKHGLSWVYDPVLLGVKLGKFIPKAEKETIAERFLSYSEMTRDYLNVEVQQGLLMAMQERYGMPPARSESLICGLAVATRNLSEFEKLWSGTVVIGI